MQTPERHPLTPEGRRRVIRAATLRPLNLLILVIGIGVFITTSELWVLLLTIPTYLSLVALAARDPIFQRRTLEGRGSPQETLNQKNSDVSPERRARWLPRGETREKVEAALDAYRKVVSAIEESDDVTKAVLEDAIPKLHTTANRLVDIARRREDASAEIQAQKKYSGSPTEERATSLRGIEAEIHAADAEISGTFEDLLTLRARVVRISIATGSDAQSAATGLNTSLDELNFRLEALGDTMSLQDNAASHTPPSQDARTGRDQIS